MVWILNFYKMKKFISISKFQELSQAQARNVSGGGSAAISALMQDPGATSFSTAVTWTFSTAGCTCKNNNPDSCMDSGIGNECDKD